MPPVIITVRNNGPYFISPDQVSEVQLIDHEGKPIPIPGKSITLCRCGASTTKPFCDRSHSRIGFKGAEAAQAAYDAANQTADAAAIPTPSSQADGAETPAPTGTTPSGTGQGGAQG